MASTEYTLTADWSATNRYTAGADVDVLISNPSGYSLRFELTGTDATPALAARRGHPIGPGQSRAMQLTSGERLWLVGEGAIAVVAV